MSALEGILRQMCPRCRQGPMYRPFSLSGWLDMYESCPICHLKFNREQGYFIGAMYVSYGLSIPPVLALVVAFWRLAPRRGRVCRVFRLSAVCAAGGPVLAGDLDLHRSVGRSVLSSKNENPASLDLAGLRRNGSRILFLFGRGYEAGHESAALVGAAPRFAQALAPERMR